MPYAPATNSIKNETIIAGVKGARESSMHTKDRIIKNEMIVFLPTYFPCKI